MRVPEALFTIINPLMRFWLRSPLHGVFSDSIMLITFAGRKTGRKYTTPVRYMRAGEIIRCSTEKKNLWWRNLAGGSAVVLRIKGQDCDYVANAIHEDTEAVKNYLREFVQAFPQDAPYVGVPLDKHKQPLEEGLDTAAMAIVLIEARPTVRS